MENNANIVLQLFGSLMKNPLLLGEKNTYSLTPDDFSTVFERVVFGAIYNLFSNGVEKISVVDIDNYLQRHDGAYQIFTKENGLEYLQDAEAMSSEENFDYYYNHLKKINAIKDLKRIGVDTSDIYPENLLQEDSEEKRQRFETMSIQEIFDIVRERLMNVESAYNLGSSVKTVSASDGLDTLLDSLKSTPDLGPNLQGICLNTACRGARKGMFYLRSAGTGVGKTRGMVGDACYLAYPMRYNGAKKVWELNGHNEKVAYVGTEQSIQEIQTLILAYLSGVNEEKILLGTYSQEEAHILELSKRIMVIYSDNFIITQLPDPTIQLVKTTIRKLRITHNIDYLFYDYIFSSPGLLTEFRDLRIREDVILGMLSTALKDMAVELKMFVMSSTQVNGDLDQKKGLRDQSCIRGAKAIADKIDFGCVTARVNEEELNMLALLIQERNITPNQVSDIYKVRRGQYNGVRVWSSVDLGTCRKIDLFMTDENFNPIPDFSPLVSKIEYDDGKMDKAFELVNKFNTPDCGPAADDKTDKVIDMDNYKSTDWSF